MKHREPKRLRTRRQILSAAQSLFLQQGYSDTTMDAIAAAADVSRASLFNHFSSKSALLGSISHDLEDRLLRALQHYREKYDRAPAVLRAWFERLAQVLVQTAPLTQQMFLQANAADGFSQLRGALNGLADSGQADGLWRDDVAAEALGEIIYLALVATLLGWHSDVATNSSKIAATTEDAIERRVSDLLTLLAPGAA